MAFLVGGANTSAVTAYNIENSLRFDGTSSYLSFTYGSAGNRKTFTYSFWCKPSKVDTPLTFLNVVPDDGNKSEMTFSPRISAYDNSGGTQRINKQTNHLARDVSAWYHIVWNIDTTQGAEADRVKLWVNGTAVTSTSFGGWETDTLPDQNQDLHYMDTHENHIGYNESASGRYFAGYLADWYCIDGTAYDASYFGETDEDSGIWKPKKASVTFGSNGYKLEFKQTGTSANASGIGADTSGNDNHFSVTNLAATDQTTDTPTNNFCTMNPLGQGGGGSTLTEGNLKETTDDNAGCPATFAVSNGKWYWEVEITAGSNNLIGIADADYYGLLATTPNDYRIVLYQADGRVFNMGSTSQDSDSGREFDTNDIMGIRLDLDSGTRTIKWYEDDTLIATENIGSSQVLLTPFSSKGGSSQTCSYNFGNPSFTVSSGNADANGYGNFEFAVPSGHYALCTKNLAEFG